MARGLAWIAVAVLAVPAQAQDAPVESAKSYTPADFARFAPRTALDMLRQVPGFPLPEQAQQQAIEQRGLGQASVNILIDGQRLSGKSNDVLTELSRIAVSNVQRIDIVDGATLNVPGLTGQVANIITAKARAITGSFAWRPSFRARQTEPRWLAGEASINGRLGGIDYTLAIENRPERNGNAGPEVVFTPDGTITDRRDETLFYYFDQPKISASLRRTATDGSIASLNASAQLFNLRLDEISLRSGPGQIDRDRRLREREDEWNYEVGGDYEFGLGAGRLKLVAVRRYEHSPYTQTLTVDFADGSPGTGDRFTQVADEGETILRGEYRWRGGGADWQLSAEGALNRLDIDNRLFTRGAGGSYQPVPLANSQARVEEKRGEAILSYGRPLGATLTIQLSAGGEVSELAQTGASGVTRRFVRPKGSVALAWKPDPRLDLSARFERKVGQLNFYDFVASSNLSAGVGNAGNVNLVPPQSWEGEVQAVRNLGAWGTITARGYARLISDIVDIVPIGATGQASGNLDSARVLGAQMKGTINFDPVGLKGAKLDLDGELRRSRLTDPVTGQPRPINETLDHRLSVEFRHDVPRTEWAWGALYERYRQTAGYRLDSKLHHRTEPGNVGLFVEHKDVFGLTVRGQVDNLIDNNEMLERNFWDGRRSNRLLYTEFRDRFYGPVFTFAITGKV